MPEHTHLFVETYNDLVGFGYDRKTDENTIQYYLQKFSDDRLMEILLPRLTDEELAEIFDLLSRLLKNHLCEEEYHQLFLRTASG